MLKNLNEVIDDNGIIYIFGCGKTGIEYYSLIKNAFPMAECMFVDNSEKYQNKGVCLGDEEFPVYEVDIINKHSKSYVVVLTSKKYLFDMRKQLMEMGVPEERIVLSEECHEHQYREFEKKIIKRKPKKKLNFVVDLAVHCNLNCQNCDHFSPLANEEFTDIVQFEKDMQRMAFLLGDDITHVDLEGGEPLLNKEICKYIEIVKKYLEKTRIKIFTNGTLLPKMTQDFWATCKKYDVQLEVTKYPIDFDYKYAEDLAEKKGVSFHVYDGGSEKTSWHKPLDLEGRQDRYDSFENCYLANGECAMLKNGRLYPCTLIPNLDYFNKYFNCNLQVTKDDYIDIYSDVSSEQIFEFLCSPPKACRYCDVKNWTNGHKWNVSKKNIKEWT